MDIRVGNGSAALQIKQIGVGNGGVLDIKRGYIGNGSTAVQFFQKFGGATNTYNSGNTTTGIGNHTETVPDGATALTLTVWGCGNNGENAHLEDSEWFAGAGGEGGFKSVHIISIAPGDWGKAISYRIGNPVDFESTAAFSVSGLSAGDFNVSGGFGGNTSNLPSQPGSPGGGSGGAGGFGGPGYDGIGNGGGGADGVEFANGGFGDPGQVQFIWGAA